MELYKKIGVVPNYDPISNEVSPLLKIGIMGPSPIISHQAFGSCQCYWCTFATAAKLAFD